MYVLRAGAFVDAAAHLSSMAAFVAATTLSNDEGKVFHGETKIDHTDRAYISTKNRTVTRSFETTQCSNNFISGR